MEHHIVLNMAKVVFFIDGVFISFCEGKFFCRFHSTGVSTSLRLLSKNSHTHACAIYAILIDTLFVPPCFTLGVLTKSTFESIKPI
jgi:hypothetical protein